MLESVSFRTLYAEYALIRMCYPIPLGSLDYREPDLDYMRCIDETQVVVIVNEGYELGGIVCGVSCLVERHDLPVQTRYIYAYAYCLGYCRCAKY